jgi:hypothetical protein
MVYNTAMDKNPLTPEEKHKKLQIEKLLVKHGYRRDDRPDHREWTKITSTFHYKIRLDQNNPDGWNGFFAQLTTYMRWDVKEKDLDRLFKFLKEDFE